MENVGLIFILTLAQSIYDYIGWALWLGESYGNLFLAYFFRTVKFLLDFPLTIFVLMQTGIFYITINDFTSWTNLWSWLHENKATLAFFNSKEFGLCDFFYIVFGFMRNNKPYTEKNIYWLFWTPLGLYRSIKETIKNRKPTRGLLTLNEFYFQLVVGQLISLIILISL